MKRPRYFWSRDSKTGKYRIIDRDLHRGMVIATADFREAAALIVIALNTAKEPHSEPARSTARIAVIGDVLQHHDQLISVQWIRGLLDPKYA